MKQWWNNLWWEYDDAIKFTFVWLTGVALIMGSLGFVVAYGSAKQYQYNCNLGERPSLYVAWWIDSDTYGYNPEGFCNQLKEKMAQE